MVIVLMHVAEDFDRIRLNPIDERLVTVDGRSDSNNIVQPDEVQSGRRVI